MRNHRRLLTAIALSGALAAGMAAAEDTSYSYVRVLDGSASVVSSGGDGAEPLELNQPLLTGDRIVVAASSRLEVVLADRTRLRLDAGSTAVLRAVAFSADATDRATRLQLAGGTLQLSVDENAQGDELPRIDLPNATVYVQDVGDLSVATVGGDSSEVVVRRGFVEIATERGSTLLRAGEAARITGASWATTRLVSAPPADAFERWARALENEGSTRRSGYVDDRLAYASANLDDYGTWVTVDQDWAWRPRVDDGWRPYWQGRWAYSPSGATWISNEPWGWVPYHYGTWDLVPGTGWVWFPGTTYSPAWVYWYWGDQWAGWCPVGYYSRHDRHAGRDRGLRFGVYGSVGGGIDLYADWSFGPAHLLFDRHHRDRFRRGGVDFAREIGTRTLPRGILTTDTRGLDPRRLLGGRDPRELLSHEKGRPGGSVDPLPDATDFIARRPEITPELRRRIYVERTGDAADRALLDPTAPAPRRESGTRDDRAGRSYRPPQGEPSVGETGSAAGGTTRGVREPRRVQPWTPPTATSDPTGWRAPRVDDLAGPRALEVRPARRVPPTGTGVEAGTPATPATGTEPAGVSVESPSDPPSHRPGRFRPRNPSRADEPPTALEVTNDSRQNWRRRGNDQPEVDLGEAAVPHAPRWQPAEPASDSPGEVRGATERVDRRRWTPPSVDPADTPSWRRPVTPPDPSLQPSASPDRSRGPWAGSERPPVRRVIDGFRQVGSGSSSPTSSTSADDRRSRPVAESKPSSPSSSSGSAPERGRSPHREPSTRESAPHRDPAPPPPPDSN